MNLRQSAAVAFKNLVKFKWYTEDAQRTLLSESDRAQIKQIIVDLMLSSPKLIQKQLSEALTDISNHDFPKDWGNLVKVKKRVFLGPHFLKEFSLLFHSFFFLFTETKFFLKR